MMRENIEITKFVRSKRKDAKMKTWEKGGDWRGRKSQIN